MKLRVFILTVLCLTSAVAVRGQEDNRPFYYYGNEKIFLEPAPDRVAGLVLQGVEVEEKYPQTMGRFESLEEAVGDRFETILLSRETVSRSVAMTTLKKAIGTKEVAPVPVYRLKELTLIPKSEVIVQFKPSTSPDERRTLLRRFSQRFSEMGRDGQYLVTLGNPQSTLSISQILNQNLDVDFAEPNFIIVSPQRPEGTWIPPDVPVAASGPLAAPFPSDPRFTKQWYLENRIQSPSQGKFKADIRIRGAWDVTRGSENIRVAVLDEAMESAHPDLTDSIARENGVELRWDAINNTDKPPVSADHHGTRVAGVIAAATHNGIGIASVAPGVKIIPIRAGTFEGNRTLWTTTDTAIIAIRKAVELHADVINCSWFMDDSPGVTQEITEAATHGRGGKGVVLVFAAGNSAGPLVYPASLASNSLPVIAVGATNSWDEVKTGNTTRDKENWASSSGPQLTLVAPGVGIATMDLSSFGSGADKGYFDLFSGTSAAAPIVSGVAALILSVHPDWKAAQVRDRLIQTTDKIDGPNRTDRAGWGRVNACRAVGGTGCD